MLHLWLLWQQELRQSFQAKLSSRASQGGFTAVLGNNIAHNVEVHKRRAPTFNRLYQGIIHVVQESYKQVRY